MREDDTAIVETLAKNLKTRADEMEGMMPMLSTKKEIR